MSGNAVVHCSICTIKYLQRGQPADTHLLQFVAFGINIVDQEPNMSKPERLRITCGL